MIASPRSSVFSNSNYDDNTEDAVLYDYKDSEYYKAVNDLYNNEFSAAFDTNYILKLCPYNEFANGIALSQIELFGYCKYDNPVANGALPAGFQIQLPVFRSLKVSVEGLYLRETSYSTITYNGGSYRRYLPIIYNVNYPGFLNTVNSSVMSDRNENVVAYFVIGKEKYTGWYLEDYHSSSGGGSPS